MVEAVAGIIQNDNEEILLMRRSKNVDHAPGKWENCGGKIEKGETPVEALKRELKEELNVELLSQELAYIYGPIDGFKAYVYLVKIQGTPKLMEPEMCDEIKWISKANLNQINLASYCRKDFEQLGWI